LAAEEAQVEEAAAVQAVHHTVAQVAVAVEVEVTVHQYWLLYHTATIN
jgi:hypothetical protein